MKLFSLAFLPLLLQLAKTNDVEFTMKCTSQAKKDVCIFETENIEKEAEKEVKDELGISKDELTFGSALDTRKDLRTRKLSHCMDRCNGSPIFCLWWCRNRRRLEESPAEDPAERRLQEERTCDGAKVAFLVENDFYAMGEKMIRERKLDSESEKDHNEDKEKDLECAKALMNIKCEVNCTFEYS